MNKVEDKFLTYLAALKKTNEAGNELMQAVIGDDKIKEVIKSKMHDVKPIYQEFKTQLKQNLAEQQDYLESLTPQEYQKLATEGLHMVEKAFDDANALVQQKMKEQEEYVTSDSFIRNSKTSLRQAAFFNKMLMKNIDHILDSYEQAFQSFEEIIEE